VPDEWDVNKACQQLLIVILGQWPEIVGVTFRAIWLDRLQRVEILINKETWGLKLVFQKEVLYRAFLMDDDGAMFQIGRQIAMGARNWELKRGG
jgi:hypothetical protein